MDVNLDLMAVLHSSDAIAQLVVAADFAGLLFLDKHGTHSRRIDFGELTVDELQFEEDVPVGYEECSSIGSSRKAEKEISIINSTTNCNFRINALQVLPISDSRNNLPVLSILKNDENNHQTDLLGTILKPGEKLNAVVRYLVSTNYTGFLGRWIIFTIESMSKISDVCIQKTTFLHGIRTIGCVVTFKGANLLSSEANRFVPQSRLMYFDNPVRSF